MSRTGNLELKTDAEVYERITGIPVPSLTLTLHNKTADAIDVTVCSQAGMAIAPIRYQRQQEDRSWIDIPFGSVVCNVPDGLSSIESGDSWIVPPDLQAFPPDAGTYRIVLLPADTSVGFPIVSNSFTVTPSFEPTT